MLAHLIAAVLLLLPEALAGQWSQREIDPKVITDVSAYTVGRNRWHLGVWEQSYGLLDNVQVGVTAPLFLLRVPNASAKITAIQTRHVDAAFNAGLYAYDLEQNLGVPGGRARVVPLTWTASWVAHRRLGVHLGQGWWLVDIQGEMPASTMTRAVEDMAGIDIGADFDALLDGTALYAGANITLQEGHLALDYRFNRRDSLVFTTRSFVSMSALVAGGVQTETATGESLEAGPSVRISRTLKNSLPAMSTLSWQLSWKRLHLRLGLPIGNNQLWLFALPRALQVYYVLGPVRDDSPPG